MYRKCMDKRSVIEIFDEVTEKYKNKPAIVFEEECLTYKELQKRSKAVSKFLIDMGIARESIVPLVVDRSVDSIVNIFGILRAGGAYLPLDNLLPAERIKYMLKVSGAKQIFCNTLKDAETMKSMGLEGIDMISSGNAKDRECDCASKRTGNQNLAYVMFTSGSEGNPKGVMIPDRGITRLVRDTDYFPFNNKLVFLQSGTLCFDAATFDVFGALLNGATLHLTDKKTLLDSELLRKKLRECNINSMFLTTPLFHQLVSSEVEIFQPLENLMVGGDVLFLEDALKLKSRFPDIRLFNGYGPTENTTFSTVYEVTGKETTDIPIGRTIDYSTTYILDKAGKPVPKGKSGELYVGGAGVALGYISDEKRTKDRFLPDPSGDGLMYRTGDMVMENEEGNLVFLGRCDSQMKYRGYRIEIAEIQKKIMSEACVKECFVTCETVEKEKVLVAFVTFEEQKDLKQTEQDKKIAELRKKLLARLPEYMIPQRFICMEKLPLNLNGKVDKNVLTDVFYSSISKEFQSETREKGNNPEENMFWNILEKNLKRSVEDQDMLYEIGLNSISAIHMLSEFKKAGLDISMRNMLSAKTVKELRLLVCDA